MSVGVALSNVVCCSVWQCVAVCGSVWQCVAACGSVWLCVAVCCSVLQCVAMCSSVLHCVALCCIIKCCVLVKMKRSVDGLRHMYMSHVIYSTIFALLCQLRLHDQMLCACVVW